MEAPFVFELACASFIAGWRIRGFMGAYWRRPESYLDARIRRAISSFSRVADAEPPLRRLRADLDSGAWDERYGDLRTRAELDIGYRVIVLQR